MMPYTYPEDTSPYGEVERDPEPDVTEEADRA